MRKGKVFRSVLAAGLAVSLAAAPMSVLAESADETELLAGVEDVLEESAQEITSTPYEWNASATFGDGLYNLAAQDGTDLSWLKGASCELKVVPGEDMLDGVLAVSLNDTQLAHVLFSADLATQMAYISIPEYFDQTIAFKPGEVLESLLSGAASSENGGSMQTQILQMIMGTGMEIVSQLQQYFTSIPADVWQQEMMNYVMPIMNNLTQESESGVLTVGSLSADVQTQTFSIPSEKMPEVISGILDSLSQDQVIGGLLESDAASSLCSVLTMVSGGSVVLNAAELKQQFQSAIESLKAQDLSGIPGIVAKISNSADQNAAAFELALNAGGQEYALYSVKAIMDGTENAFEVTPSAMLMSMYGVEGGEMALLGQGSTADGKLNEEIELTMNGASAAKMTISDLDLAGMMNNGGMNGTIHIEAAQMSLDIVYASPEAGTQSVEYSVNGEMFYQIDLHSGPAADDQIEEINLENVVEGSSVDEVMNWINTFKSDEAARLLSEAGSMEILRCCCSFFFAREQKLCYTGKEQGNTSVRCGHGCRQEVWHYGIVWVD